MPAIWGIERVVGEEIWADMGILESFAYLIGALSGDVIYLIISFLLYLCLLFLKRLYRLISIAVGFLKLNYRFPRSSRFIVLIVYAFKQIASSQRFSSLFSKQ